MVPLETVNFEMLTGKTTQPAWQPPLDMRPARQLLSARLCLAKVIRYLIAVNTKVQLCTMPLLFKLCSSALCSCPRDFRP